MNRSEPSTRESNVERSRTGPAKNTPSARDERDRARHPGVWLLDPNNDTGGRRKLWRARFIDASGKRKTITLEPRDGKNKRTALEWAIQRSESLQLERSQVKAGIIHVVEGMPLREAVERFFAAHPRLSEGTRRSYRTAIATLTHGRERLTTLDLTPKLLRHWRDERVNARRRVTRRGGTTGEKTQSKELRSAASVNKELRSVGRWLYWMLESHFVRLTRDDLRSVLKKEDFKPETKPILDRDQIAELMTACAKHDAGATHAKTGNQRHPKITPFVRFLLLTGMRVGEAIALTWRDVKADRVIVRAEVSKTRKKRKVNLAISPTALRGLERGHSDARVFDMSEGDARAAIKRLASCDAPDFTWHTLRRTCGTFLTCAPGIYDAASAYMSARRLGHSVKVAEVHYLGEITDISKDAKTLEQAMGIV